MKNLTDALKATADEWFIEAERLKKKATEAKIKADLAAALEKEIKD